MSNRGRIDDVRPMRRAKSRLEWRENLRQGETWDVAPLWQYLHSQDGRPVHVRITAADGSVHFAQKMRIAKPVVG